jgi:hypothetical protein
MPKITYGYKEYCTHLLMSKVTFSRKTNFVIAGIAMSFILSASLFSMVPNNFASALDMSGLKQGASSLLSGNNGTGSSSSSSIGNANSSTANDNSTSSSSSLQSSLQQKATDAIGSMIK